MSARNPKTVRLKATLCWRHMSWRVDEVLANNPHGQMPQAWRKYARSIRSPRTPWSRTTATGVCLSKASFGDVIHRYACERFCGNNVRRR